jgi:hypothetical protein
MRDLGQEEYVTDLLEPAEVSALALRVLANSDDIRRTLAERLPGMQRRARESCLAYPRPHCTQHNQRQQYVTLSQSEGHTSPLQNYSLPVLPRSTYLN